MSYIDDLLKQDDEKQALQLYHQQNEHRQQPQQPQQVDPVYAYYMGNPQQEEEQPTGTESPGILNGFMRGSLSGGAGVIGNQAELGNLYGIGDGATAQWAKEVAQNNAKKKQYGLSDMIPFASDYWTNPEGAAYDAGNAFGSSVVLGAETAAVMATAGTAAGALGIGTGTLRAIYGAEKLAQMSAPARAAALGQVATKTIANKMSQRAAEMGLGRISKVLSGPVGQLYALNILNTPFEVSAEMGSAGQEALARGANIDEARKEAWITGATQAPLLALSNTLEVGNLGTLFAKDLAKVGGKKALLSIIGKLGLEAVQNAWEEGMQQSSHEYAAGTQDLLGVVNPMQWSQEAQEEAAAGLTGGLALGGGHAIINRTLGGNKEENNTPNPDQARTYLQNLVGNPNNPLGLSPEQLDSVDGVLETGDNEQILEAAQSYGWQPNANEEIQEYQPTRLDNAKAYLQSVQNGEQNANLETNPASTNSHLTNATQEQASQIAGSVLENGSDEEILAAARQLGWQDTEPNTNPYAGLAPLEYAQQALQDPNYNIPNNQRAILQNVLNARERAVARQNAEVEQYVNQNAPRDENGNIPEKLPKNIQKGVNDIKKKHSKIIGKIDTVLKHNVDRLKKSGDLARGKEHIDTNQVAQANPQGDIQRNADNLARQNQIEETLDNNPDVVAHARATNPQLDQSVVQGQTIGEQQRNQQNDVAQNADILNINNQQEEQEDAENRAYQVEREQAKQRARDNIRHQNTNLESARLQGENETEQRNAGLAQQSNAYEQQQEQAHQERMRKANERQERINARQQNVEAEARESTLGKENAPAPTSSTNTQPTNQSTKPTILPEMLGPQTEGEARLWAKWDRETTQGKKHKVGDNQKASYKRYQTYKQANDERQLKNFTPRNKDEKATYARWDASYKHNKKPRVFNSEKELYDRYLKYRELREGQEQQKAATEEKAKEREQAELRNRVSNMGERLKKKTNMRKHARGMANSLNQQRQSQETTEEEVPTLNKAEMKEQERSNILVEKGNPIKNAKAKQKEAHKAIVEFLQPIIDALKNGVGKGVTDHYVDAETGLEVDASDLRGKEETKPGSSIRHERYSNNDPWYQQFFRENHRRPTQADYLEVAEEMARGEGGWDAGDEVRDVAGTFDKEFGAEVAQANAETLDYLHAMEDIYGELADELQAKENTNESNAESNGNKVQSVQVQHKQSKASKKAKTDDNESQGQNSEAELQVKGEEQEQRQKQETNPADGRAFDNHPMVKLLRKLGYTVYTDQEHWDESQASHRQAEILKAGEKGTVYGATENGVIYLNPKGWAATSHDTPIHEYIHLWFKMLEKSNPELLKKGIELLKKTRTWNAVRKDKNYKFANLSDEEIANSEKLQRDLASEVLARIGGERGVYRMQEMQRTMQKMGESQGIISRIISWIGQLFRHTQKEIAPTEDLANMNVWQFVDKPLNDILNGLSDKEMQEKSKSNENAESGNDNAEFKITSGTYFSGGGLVDYALKSVIDGQFAVEKNSKIAAVYEDNNGKHMLNMDVQDFDPSKYKGKVDYFHASPSCPDYSRSKVNAKELPIDITTAKATAKALDAIRPKAFTLENVPEYKDSGAMKVITDMLDKLGYHYDADVYNAADYGAATSRDRLLLRAYRDEELPTKPKPTNKDKHIGWYSVVEDVIDELPKATVPKWIQERIDKNNIDVKNLKQPLLFLHGNKGRGLVVANADEPAPTLLASDHDQRIFMPDGRVLKATPQVIARIQGLDDNYKLPTNNQALAYRIIGNGVPVKLTQNIFGPMLKQIDEEGGQEAEFQIVHHGSKAKFKEFDTEHLLSGTGDMVHGWGLYFAKDPEISKKYRNINVDPSQRVYDEDIVVNGNTYHVHTEGGETILTKNGDKFNRDSAEARAIEDYLIGQGGYLDAAIAKINRDIEWTEQEGVWLPHRKAEDEKSYKQRVDEQTKKELADLNKQKEFLEQLLAAKDLNKDRFKVTRTRNNKTARLYTVDAPDDNLLLREDATYWDQPLIVKNAFEKLFKHKPPMNATGSQIYHELAGQLGGQKEASLALLKLGVKGISYNGKRDGECLVLFDANDAKIQKRYDINDNEVEFQIAYHGSPYSFDKFMSDHIGSGQGAQSHGWGLYFSLQKETAQKYRDTLSNPSQFNDEPNEPINIQIGNNKIRVEDIMLDTKISVNGRNVDNASLENAIMRIADFDYFLSKENSGSVQDIIKRERGKIATYNNVLAETTDAEEKQYIKERLKDLASSIKDLQRLARLGDKFTAIMEEPRSYNGKLYQVDIPENDVLLDENKPFNKQPTKVRVGLKALQSHIDDATETGTAGVFPNITNDEYDGDYIYMCLEAFAGSPRKASELLNKYGIEGIRYNGQEDGPCVVVFDDKAINLLHRYDANNKAEFSIKAPTEQLSDVRKQYEGTDKWMKAPNGEDTNLDEKQWLTVRTPAFKNWFGDWENNPKEASKIVDENGEPRVVYHQTNSFELVNVDDGRNWYDLDWKERDNWEERDDFDEHWQRRDFKTFSRARARYGDEMPAFFFSTEYDKYHEYGDRTIEAFLNIRNPAIDPQIENRKEDLAGEKTMKKLIADGYDGFIRDNSADELPNEINAFYPNQIKSATDNNGEFSKDNDNIEFSVKSPAFKKWFGNSILKDEDGNPQVFYRGLGEHYDVNKQDDVTWITDNEEQADSYSQHRYEDLNREVLQVYARVENPADLGDSWDQMNFDDFKQKRLIPLLTRAFRNNNITKEDSLKIRDEIKNMSIGHLEDGKDEYHPMFEYYNEIDDIVPLLKKMGYDALKVTEGGHQTYGVIGKSNVKSATNNNGNYDINNDDIEYSIKNYHTKPGTDADLSAATQVVSRPDISTVKGYVEEGKQRVKDAKEQHSLDPVTAGLRFREKWIDKYDAISIFDKAMLAAVNQRLLAQGEPAIERLAESEQYHTKVQMVANDVGGVQFCLLSGDKGAMDIAEKHYNLPAKNKIRVGKEDTHVSLQMITDYLADNEKSLKAFMDASGAENPVQALDTVISAYGVIEDYENNKKAHDAWERGGRKGKEPAPYKFPKGMTLAKYQKVLNKAPQALHHAADMYFHFNNDLIHILRHAGIITENELKSYEKLYKHFCPLMRDFSDSEALDRYIRDVFGGGGIANVTNPLKHRSGEGSTRDILSPLGSTAIAIRAYVTRAERNMLAQEMVKTAEANGLDHLIKLYKDQNASPNPDESTIGVLFNGKKRIYYVHPALYGPLTNNFAPTVRLDIAWAKAVASALRIGATTSPSFIVRNFFRDTFTAGISSHYGFIPVYDSIRGALALMNDPKFRTRFYARGIVNSNQFRDRRSAEKALIKQVNGKSKEYGLIDLAKAVWDYAWGRYSGFNELIEACTRAGLMKRAEEAGASPAQAAYEAIYGTINFNRSGTAGQQVNKIVPFFNACIQGGDLLYQEFKKDPQGTMFKISMYIIAPSLILWLANSDEPWYKELDPRIKQNYWCLPGGVRIQKTEWAIIFGSGIETLCDIASKKDPKAWKSFTTAARDTFLPNFIPTVMLPLIEWQANYSFFRDKPIVNSSMAKLPDEMQYSNYTSAGAIALGKATKLSPMKLENAWRSLTGTMGAFALQTTDLFDRDKASLPAKKTTEKPIMRDFFLNDTNLNRSTSDFFDLYTASQQQHRAYGKIGHPTKEVSEISKAHSMITKAYRMKKDIDADKKLNSQQKRVKEDKIDKDIKRIASGMVKKYGKKYNIT